MPPLSNDPSACAFNVESIQIDGSGNPKFIDVDFALTDIRDQQISAPTNLLIDSGIGKIGASEFVVVVCEDFIPNVNDHCSGGIEFNGEKPQGMFLIGIIGTGSLSSTSQPEVTCFDGQGNATGCPTDAPGWDKVLESIRTVQEKIT